ncbi:hypothetical protein KBD69_05230 [Candidatus Woesebacteria bacterium]|nr:hypothetical protein [Candidatus Woesebacteria bacterium]
MNMNTPIQIEIGFLSEFIRRVIFQWITLLLFLPSAYDFLHTYFPEPIRSMELEPELRKSFIFFAVVIAVYLTWRREYQTHLSLSNRKTKFTVGFSFYKLRTKEFLSKIDERIRKLESEIPDLESERYFDITSTIFRRKTQQSVAEYVDSLKQHREEVLLFQAQQTNLIGLCVEIEADKYDEHIGVRCISTRERFTRASDLSFPSLPSAPYEGFTFAPQISNYMERDRFRTNLDFGESVVSCNLNNLKKGEKVMFINEGIYFLSNDNDNNKLNVEIEISSKNSDGIQHFSTNTLKSEITQYRDVSSLDEFEIR